MITNPKIIPVLSEAKSLRTSYIPTYRFSIYINVKYFFTTCDGSALNPFLQSQKLRDKMLYECLYVNQKKKKKKFKMKMLMKKHLISFESNY